jgi:hypothetical protein
MHIQEPEPEQREAGSRVSGDILATPLNTSQMIMRSSERKRSILILVRGKWTADMAKDLSRGQASAWKHLALQSGQGPETLITKHLTQPLGECPGMTD